MRFELTTFSLARRRSTTELRPHQGREFYRAGPGLSNPFGPRRPASGRRAGPGQPFRWRSNRGRYRGACAGARGGLLGGGVSVGGGGLVGVRVGSGPGVEIVVAVAVRSSGGPTMKVME